MRSHVARLALVRIYFSFTLSTSTTPYHRVRARNKIVLPFDRHLSLQAKMLTQELLLKQKHFIVKPILQAMAWGRFFVAGLA
jgi:hypothetical protein